MADPITREERRPISREALLVLLRCVPQEAPLSSVLPFTVLVSDLRAILEAPVARIPALPISEEDERTVDNLVRRKTAERARASLAVGDIVRDPDVLRAGDRVSYVSVGDPPVAWTVHARKVDSAPGWWLAEGGFASDEWVRAGRYRLISKAPTTEEP